MAAILYIFRIYGYGSNSLHFPDLWVWQQFFTFSGFMGMAAILYSSGFMGMAAILYIFRIYGYGSNSLHFPDLWVWQQFFTVPDLWVWCFVKLVDWCSFWHF